MSVRRCQQEVDSAEFGEWLAEWSLEADEAKGDRAPSDEEFETKMDAWMTRMNARR